MYNENGEKQTAAVRILEEIRTHPSAWRSVDRVLRSRSPETKYFGLQLLEGVIRRKWRSLNAEEQASLRNYVIRMWGLERIDKALLQLLRRDWSVMVELLAASAQDATVCENCMKVLAQLKPDAVQGGLELLDLCRLVLERATSGSLVQATLRALSNLLSFMPPQPRLLARVAMCMGLSQLRDASLTCLAIGLERKPSFGEIFAFSREVLMRMDVSRSAAMFLTTFLRNYGVEVRDADPGVLRAGLELLLRISEDRELLPLCVEYWRHYVGEVYSGETDVLERLRLLVIGGMARPEEVMVVQLEDGTAIREESRDTEEAQLYAVMQDILIRLTQLDTRGTVDTLMRQLEVDKQATCWAIGAISGALVEEDERDLIVAVLKNLLSTCEHAHTKDDKAVVASNIMYIVAQYPRFLRAHERFLRTVVYKLFEFMHELHEGVQDMACETFRKLVLRCPDQFLQPQPGHALRFISEIIANLKMILSDLSQPQLLLVYEALALKGHVDSLMELPNQTWNTSSSLPQLVQVLRINTRVCRRAGPHFQRQMSTLFPDLLHRYTYSDESAHIFRAEILSLISAFLDVHDSPSYVVESIVPGLLSLQFPRVEPSVVALMTSLLNCLGESASPFIYTIFGTVFSPTLDLITKDFVNFPDLRAEFAVFVLIFLRKCLSSFAQFNDHHCGTVVRTVLWLTQHPTREVAHTGFLSLRVLFGGRLRKHAKFGWIMRQFYLGTMEHVLTLLADPLSTAGGIKPFAVFFSDMMGLAEDWGERICPEWDNVPYVFNYCVEFLQRRHGNPGLMKIFVEGLFSFDKDFKGMKRHLRDFVVQIGGEDNDLEERADEMSMARLLKASHKPKIPGLLDNDDTFDDTF